MSSFYKSGTSTYEMQQSPLLEGRETNALKKDSSRNFLVQQYKTDNPKDFEKIKKNLHHKLDCELKEIINNVHTNPIVLSIAKNEFDQRAVAQNVFSPSVVS